MKLFALWLGFFSMFTFYFWCYCCIHTCSYTLLSFFWISACCVSVFFVVAVFRTDFFFRLMPQQAPLICHFVFMAHFTFRQSGAHPPLSPSFVRSNTHTHCVNVNNKSIRWGRNACNTHIIQFEMHTLMTWSHKMPNEKTKKNNT